MALYDTPPSIDPRTGRLPTYKQVLKQDPTTGVYKIKYEYTPIVSASTDGVDLQKMLTTPITELDVDPVTSDDKDDDTGEDTGEDTTTTTQMSITERGGGENNPYSSNFQGGAGGFNADNAVDPNSLEGLMSTAYPGIGDKVAGFVFGKVLSGINPLVGLGYGQITQANQEKAEQKIKDQIEDGTIASGLSTSQIEALAENKNIPGYLSDAFSNILDSSGMIPTRRPSTTPTSGIIPTRRPTQPISSAATTTSYAQPLAGGFGLGFAAQGTIGANEAAQDKATSISSGDIVGAYNAGMLEAGRRGLSRDKGAEAAENAANEAATNMSSSYTGNSYTNSTTGTTQVGTYSERREAENIGRNDDGTAEAGSVADARDRVRNTTAETSRDVDRNDAVGNAARGNEVGDKHGNAVTDRNGNAVNTGKTSTNDKGGGNNPRVICTELYRQGLMPKEDWRLDLWYTQNYLSRRHIIGYWYYAIPMVKIMRKNKVATNVWKHIAINRTKDIKWRLGKGKFNLLGRVYSIALETTSNILGHFVEEKDYKVLYKGEV